MHLVTRLKLVPAAAQDPSLTGEERTRGQAFAAGLSLPILTRTWQMLLKGLADIKDAPRPIAAADMVLVRLAYAADLPTPDEALRQIAASPAASSPKGPGGPVGGVAQRAISGGSVAPAIATAPAAVPVQAPQPVREPSLQPRAFSFADVVALAASHRDISMKTALERDVRLVRFEEGAIDFEAAPGASPTLAQTLKRKLEDWTGIRWTVALSQSGGAPSVRDQAMTVAEREKRDAANNPLVRKILETFPGAEVVAVHAAPAPEAEPPAPALQSEPLVEDDVAYADETLTDDDL